MGLYALGKLKKGISVSQAETEMRQLAAQLEKEYPAVNSGHGVLTQSLQTSIVENVRSTLLVLMGAVGFVLLIACVNVANLSLARSLVRQQEMGIRMALGAGRGRLIRQSLSESFLLSVLGGLAGILVARLLLSALISLAPPTLPRVADVQLSGRVLLFTAAVTLLTSLLFGLLPALSSTRITAAFTEGGRTSTSGPLRRRRRARPGGGARRPTSATASTSESPITYGTLSRPGDAWEAKPKALNVAPMATCVGKSEHSRISITAIARISARCGTGSLPEGSSVGSDATAR